MLDDNEVMGVYGIDESSDSNEIRGVMLRHGMRLSVRDFVLENLVKEDYVLKNFRLNIKRKNRWWYSVYFKGRGYLEENEETGAFYY